MADELEKRWNKSYATSKMKYENDRKVLQSLNQKQSQKAAVKKAETQKPVPYTEVIFCSFLLVRIYSAIASHITDCDETYNFWEPTHYLAFKSGFQTWEYNPKFALRSYLYVGMHAVLAKLFYFVLKQKVFVFYTIRIILATFCAVAEDQFYSSIYRKFGSFIANCWLLISLFAPGMFIASSAFLPSSFAMYCVTLAYSAWLDSSHQSAVLWIAVGSILGWPFVAVLGIPIFWDSVVKNGQFRRFTEHFFISLMYTISPVIIVDLMLYRRLTITPLNILLYNVFNPHGSELYGTEPASFYLLNGFLNFNLAFPLALLSLPTYALFQIFNKDIKAKILYLLAPLYLWLGIMFAAPHKEERFLFPVYPLISLAAAVLLYIIWKSTSFCFGYFYKHMKEASLLNISGFFILYLGLSLARIAALETYYRAPMNLYRDVYRIPESGAVVCLGKEWHRYPGSFFLPEGASARFIKSAFTGQLPQRYYENVNGTYAPRRDQNDGNREESSVYLNIKQCDYLVDLDLGVESQLEPRYNTKAGWTSIKSYPFLNAAKSKTIARAFYIPGYSRQNVKFGSYHLLKRTKLIKQQEEERERLLQLEREHQEKRAQAKLHDNDEL